MTIDQLTKLSDKEVRERIARAMGWEKLEERIPRGLNLGYYYYRNGETFAHSLPDFVTDLNAAFTLVEKLRGEWAFSLIYEAGGWIAEFYQPDCTYTIEPMRAVNAIAARAICLAFLAVTEREEG